MRRPVTTALSCTAIILSLLPASAQEKKAVIGMSVPALQNPFWRSFADFRTGAATALGAETVIVDPNKAKHHDLQPACSDNWSTSVPKAKAPYEMRICEDELHPLGGAAVEAYTSRPTGCATDLTAGSP